MMAETVIFAEQTLEGFAVGDIGVPGKDLVFGEDIDAFTLVSGKMYRVLWDGTEFEVIAQDASALFIEGALALGNLTAYGLSGNNEPFIIGWTKYGVSFFAADGDESTTHTIAIYLIVETAEVVLKDHGGNDLTYDGSLPINLLLSDGTTKNYIPADNVPEPVEAEVALDFSGGDMEVTPEDGTTFGKVAIPIPANLTPANIAKDVDIAGVVGTLAGGGGSKWIASSGSFTMTSAGTMTVEHGLGVVPDIVMLRAVAFGLEVTVNGSFIFSGVGFSSKLKADIDYQSFTETCKMVTVVSGYKLVSTTYSTHTIDVASAMLEGICDATESCVTFGDTTFKLGAYEYIWHAFARADA